MRVLYLVNAPRARLTGAARRVLSLVRAGVARGAEVAIAAPAGSALERAARQEHIRFHPASFVPRPRDVRRLRAIVRAERPDVLHAMSAVALALAAPGAMLRRPGRSRSPALFVSILVDPASDMVFADQRRRRLATRLRNLLARRLAPRLDALFAVSGVVAQSLASLDVRGRIVVSGAVLDLADLEQRAASAIVLPEGGPRIGSAVGQLEPLKGVDDLVTAFARVAGTRREAVLLIAGEGSRRDALEALAARLGVADRVHLLGYLEEPAPFTVSLDLYVSPSLTEGLGQSIAEAMALGVPVVATDVGGVRELVADDRGVLVPAGDPVALAGAIERLLDDPALARRLAAQARAHVLDRYGRDAAVEAVWAEYMRAVGRRRRGER